MTDLKECQQCHNMLPKDNFYKRKDRNGEYTWKDSYCKPCQGQKSIKYRREHREKFRESENRSRNKYYHNNKDKVKIIQKRYYYNKLPLVKKERYRQRLKENFPHWFHQIVGDV